MSHGMYIKAADNEAVWKAILDVLAKEDGVWSLDCLDRWPEGRLEGRLKEGIYTASELRGAVTGPGTILFARLMRFPVGHTPDQSIENYADYMNSSCQSVIFCVDGGCFEVYAKDRAPLERMMDLLGAAASSAEWIEDPFADRTRFWV